jgi:hypothetical protein
MTDDFKLHNDPPKKPKEVYHSLDRTKQRMLITGLGLEPGQLDMFEEEEEEEHEARPT